jgi:hypothetical protein
VVGKLAEQLTLEGGLKAGLCGRGIRMAEQLTLEGGLKAGLCGRGIRTAGQWR